MQTRTKSSNKSNTCGNNAFYFFQRRVIAVLHPQQYDVACGEASGDATPARRVNEKVPKKTGEFRFDFSKNITGIRFTR
jgi:hypothetical protein